MSAPTVEPLEETKESEKPTSKMQVIVDRIQAAGSEGRFSDAITAIVEAIELLSRAERQNMNDIERLRTQQPWDGRIGGSQ